MENKTDYIRMVRFLTILTFLLIVFIGITMSFTYLTDYLYEINWFGEKSYKYKGWDHEIHWSRTYSKRHVWYNVLGSLMFFGSLAKIMLWGYYYLNIKDTKNDK